MYTEERLFIDSQYVTIFYKFFKWKNIYHQEMKVYGK